MDQWMLDDALVQSRAQMIEPKIEIRKSKPQQQNKNITKSVLTVIDILTQEPEIAQKSAVKLTTTPISSLKSTPTKKVSINNFDSLQIKPQKQVCNVTNLDFKKLEQPRLTRQVVYNIVDRNRKPSSEPVSQDHVHTYEIEPPTLPVRQKFREIYSALSSVHTDFTAIPNRFYKKSSAKFTTAEMPASLHIRNIKHLQKAHHTGLSRPPSGAITEQASNAISELKKLPANMLQEAVKEAVSLGLMSTYEAHSLLDVIAQSEEVTSVISTPVPVVKTNSQPKNSTEKTDKQEVNYCSLLDPGIGFEPVIPLSKDPKTEEKPVVLKKETKLPKKSIESNYSRASTRDSVNRPGCVARPGTAEVDETVPISLIPKRANSPV